MSWLVLVPLIVNTGISCALGMFWYSFNGFGKLWAKSSFGSLRNFEKTLTKSREKLNFTIAITVLCSFLFNTFLILFIRNVYQPFTVLEIFLMSILIVAVYVFFELPHVCYENRSFTSMVIHSGFHFAQTFFPLLFYKLFYNMPIID